MTEVFKVSVTTLARFMEEIVPTLLLVDDDDTTRIGIRMMLEKGGYRDIIDTDDGATALDLFKTNNIDLLITDLERPGMDGVALIRAVRRIDPNAKILVVSAYSEDTVRRLLDNDISIPYLPKPFDRRVLLALVERVFAAK